MANTPKGISMGLYFGQSIFFYDADNSNVAEFKAASVTTADMAYTWPAAGPAVNGYIMSCTTAGVMSWVANAGATFANPSASVGLTAVNGSASTAMRSDGAPPLSQAITPTWTGLHTFQNPVTDHSSATAYNSSPTHDITGRFKYKSDASLSTLVKIVFGKENTNDNDQAGFIDFYTRTAAGSSAKRLSISSVGVVNIAGLSVSRYLKTDGSKNLSTDLTEVAGTVFSGPVTGADDVPSFKAQNTIIGTPRHSTESKSSSFNVVITTDVVLIDLAASSANIVITFTSLGQDGDGREVIIKGSTSHATNVVTFASSSCDYESPGVWLPCSVSCEPRPCVRYIYSYPLNKWLLVDGLNID